MVARFAPAVSFNGAEEAAEEPALRCRRAVGEVEPTPTLPEFNIVIASVAPLLPVRKCMSAPVAPTPDVVCKDKSEVVAVPPTNKGFVSPANVGLEVVAISWMVFITPLEAVKFVELNAAAPLVEPSAAALAIVILGVVPPEEAIGVVPVTLVTPVPDCWSN